MMRIDVDEWQIRSFRTQDAEALARYANNRNVSRNLRDAFPYPYTFHQILTPFTKSIPVCPWLVS